MKFLLLVAGISQVAAFVTLSTKAPLLNTVLHARESSSDDWLLNRRDVLAATVAATTTWSWLPNEAFAAGGMGQSSDKPIAVIGAGGKVGRLCTKLLNEKKLYTRAVTRSGRDVLETPSNYVSYMSGDVTKYDSIRNAIQGASGVIFAASASGKKKGGDPAHVDYLGVYNTAKACLECGVPKLAVVSAGTATRPDSAGYKATNFFVKYVYGEKIMDYKIAGEQIMRDLYSSSTNTNNLAYTVVRPGGLSDRPAAGPQRTHVSQGDVYSSEVSREDVAATTVAALLSKSADFTTFELNTVGEVYKAQGNLPDLPSNLVHAGSNTYEGLMDGLLTDAEIKKAQPDLINDFRGNNIEPVESLA